MIKFMYPWFVCLFPLPWLILKFRSEKDTEHVSIWFPYAQRLVGFNSNAPKNDKLSMRDQLLLGLTWLSLIVSLMHPCWVKDLSFLQSTGYDLMVAVDLSRSMEALDFEQNGARISRINATKKVVSNFVKQRLGDRIGLIVFAEQAFMPIPLTLDNKSVTNMLNNLLIGIAGDSTSIGDAIGIAVKALRNRPESSRVLVLLTDGEDTTSSIPPLEAAKLAANSKIKIYTVGVGSEGLVPVPDQNGGMMMAQVSIDENLLQEISAMTGGTYSRASNVMDLYKIYEDINKLEKTEKEQKPVMLQQPLFFWPLLLGLFLLFISWFKNYQLVSV